MADGITESKAGAVVGTEEYRSFAGCAGITGAADTLAHGSVTFAMAVTGGGARSGGLATVAKATFPIVIADTLARRTRPMTRAIVKTRDRLVTVTGCTGKPAGDTLASAGGLVAGAVEGAGRTAVRDGRGGRGGRIIRHTHRHCT